MKCKKAKILISAALDGEISRKETLALGRHVSLCADCAREKVELADLRVSMSSWADESPSEWLAQSFACKLADLTEEKRAVEPKPRWRFGVFGPAAAGLAMAALLIVMVFHNRASLPTPTESPKRGPVIVAPDHPKKTGGQIVQVESAGGGRGRIQASDHHGPRHIALAPKNPPFVQPVPPPSTGPGAGAIADEIPVSGVAPSAAADEVKFNLGEAGIAMNESMEKLRGALQEAVDLVVSKPPMPAVEPIGGNTP